MRIKHRIFVKGELCHALLYSYNYPNILIPVKGFIRDSMWDATNPLYKLKILKFYDNLDFLKKYFFNMNFRFQFDGRAKKINLAVNKFKDLKSLHDRLKLEDQDKFFIIVDSLMATKTKAEMKIIYNKIQYALICKKFKDIKELSTRTFYSGIFRMEPGAEFKKRLYHFIGDKFENKNENFERFSKGL